MYCSSRFDADRQVCKQILGLKIGVLAGTSIWRHSTSDSARAATVAALNDQTLDGIVMTDRVGACGHNLVGANVMIFIGSLYSEAYEHQAIGKSSVELANKQRECVGKGNAKSPERLSSQTRISLGILRRSKSNRNVVKRRYGCELRSTRSTRRRSTMHGNRSKLYISTIGLVFDGVSGSSAI